jgi:hypothetical protein
MLMKKYPFLLLLLILPCFGFAGDFIFGLNLSTPILMGGTFGYRLDAAGPKEKALMIEAEAGLGGGKLLVGMDGMNEGFGTALKVSLLKTWFEPINVDEDQTYLGAEFQMGNTGFYASPGGYGHISGDGGDSWITTLSLGIRFK